MRTIIMTSLRSLGVCLGIFDGAGARRGDSRWTVAANGGGKLLAILCAVLFINYKNFERYPAQSSG